MVVGAVAGRPGYPVSSCVCGEEEFLGREVLLEPGRGRRGVVAVAGQRVGRLPQKSSPVNTRSSRRRCGDERSVGCAYHFSPIRPIQPAKAAAHW